MCVDMYVGMCVDMCVKNMCAAICVAMCVTMCTDVCVDGTRAPLHRRIIVRLPIPVCPCSCAHVYETTAARKYVADIARSSVAHLSSYRHTKLWN